MSEVDTTETTTTETVTTAEEKYYTQKEVDDMLTKAQKSARSIGYKSGKEEKNAPYLELIKSTPGFEDYSDLETALKEALPLASDRKKNARHEETVRRELEGAKMEKDNWKTKYKDAVINAQLQTLTAGTTNPRQVALLLQTDYRFEIDESEGEPKLVVLKPNGEQAMKDAWTPLEPKDLVEKFKSEYPHFVTSEEKKSMGTQSKGGLPNVGLSLEALAKIPIGKLTPEQRIRWDKARGEGLFNPMSGDLTPKGLASIGKG